MSIPLQVTTRNIDKSQALEERIGVKVEKLGQLIDNILSCHVVLEAAQKNKHKGNLFAVHINVKVPNKEFNVTHSEDESIHVALRDAFAKMRRQLEDHNRQLHGEVKMHAELLHGKVVRLFEDFGFIEGTDGEEYYFHANNMVHPSFGHVGLQMAVHFIPAMGDEGPQAHRVSAHKSE